MEAAGSVRPVGSQPGFVLLDGDGVEFEAATEWMLQHLDKPDDGPVLLKIRPPASGSPRTVGSGQR